MNTVFAAFLVLGAALCVDSTELIPGNAYSTPMFQFFGGPAWGPLHTFYALSPSTFFNIVPNRHNSWTTTPKILTVSDLDKVPEWEGPLPWRDTVDPQTAIALAKRMVGKELLYRRHRCNCRHYTDYLLYGETFGTWWDVTYMTISDDCPLHEPLNSATNVTSSFTLRDGFGNTTPLGPVDPDL
nr:PREDICTED: uncharacterized protein LOC109040062 [Bemisia tabaci]